VGGKYFRVRIPKKGGRGTRFSRGVGQQFAVYWGYCNTRSDGSVVGEIRIEDVRCELRAKQHVGGMGGDASPVEKALQGVDINELDIKLYPVEPAELKAGVRPVDGEQKHLKDDDLGDDEVEFLNVRKEGKEHAAGKGERRKKSDAKKAKKRKKNATKKTTGLGFARKGVGMYIKWTTEMVKELKRMHNKHLEDKEGNVVGGNQQYSRGSLFSGVKAVEGLKKKFPYLKKNNGFHSDCVTRKVRYLGLGR